MTRLTHGTEARALHVSVSPFFSRCASSQMTNWTPSPPALTNRSAWILNVS